MILNAYLKKIPMVYLKQSNKIKPFLTSKIVSNMCYGVFFLFIKLNNFIKCYKIECYVISLKLSHIIFILKIITECFYFYNKYPMVVHVTVPMVPMHYVNF